MSRYVVVYSWFSVATIICFFVDSKGVFGEVWTVYGRYIYCVQRWWAWQV